MKRMKATLHFTELLLALIKGNTGLVDALHILARYFLKRLPTLLLPLTGKNSFLGTFSPLNLTDTKLIDV